MTAMGMTYEIAADLFMGEFDTYRVSSTQTNPNGVELKLWKIGAYGKRSKLLATSRGTNSEERGMYVDLARWLLVNT